MADLRAAGFWSYARADDGGESGRIVELAGDLQEEYALLTGNELELFVDRDLAWGDEWRARIDEALAGVTFFIPIVTPRFFQREECRRELLSFDARSRAAGLGELLLPILYIDADGLSEDAEDEALRAIARIQSEDWTELRLEDRGSPEYRKGVNRLAKRLKEVAEAVIERPVIAGSGVVEESAAKLKEARGALAELREDVRGESEELGLIEVLAAAEEALPRMNETVTEIAGLLEEIGQLAEESSAAIQASDAAGKGFAGRLRVIRQLAEVLDAPSQRLLNLASEYGSDLRRVDAGFSALIELSRTATSDEDREAAVGFGEAVKGMAAAGRESVQQMRDFSRMLEQSASYSRDLRPVLQRMQDAVHRIADGQAVMDSWVAGLDAAKGSG